MSFDQQVQVTHGIMPGENILTGMFTFSASTFSNIKKAYLCSLYDSSGKLIASVKLGSEHVISSPIVIAELSGTMLIAKCNFNGSGMPDKEVPMDFSKVGGLLALNQMNIAFNFYEYVSRQPVKKNTDDPVIRSYLTGFDETGAYYFLSYIPWIASHMVMSAPPSQNSQYALSGRYSCQLNESVLGQSYIDSIDLTVPAGSTSVVISFATYLLKAVPMGSVLKLDYYENGSFVSSVDISLYNRPTINNWYNMHYRHTFVASTMSSFKFVLSLYSTGSLGAILTIDNLAINFMANPPAADDRMMVYNDESGTLYGLDAYVGTQNWTFNGSSSFLSSSILVNNNLAFIADGNTQSNLYAVNVNTGTQVWQTALQGSMYCAPVISGAYLIAGCSNGLVYAINMATGAIAWSANFGNSVSATDTVVGYVNGIGADNHGMIYLATDTGIYAMNVNSRQSIWYYQTSQPVPFAPCVTEEEVIYGDVAGNIVCLNKATGVGKWRVISAAPINSQPYLVGGVVIIGNDGGTIAGYTVQTGANVWSLNFPGTMIRSFTIDGPYLHFAANAINGNCYCYSFSIGIDGKWTLQQVWSKELPLGAQCPPLLAHNDVCYTASNRELYALNKLTGESSWDFSSGSIGFASPAIVAPKPIPSVSRRYDQYCYLLSHNAYANIDDGWTYAQQSHSITEQLNLGARALELDIYKRTVGTTPQVVYDHAGLGNWRIFLTAPWKLLWDSLSEIKTWLDNHPTEIVTIVFEQPDFQNPDPMVTQAFSDSGIASYVYYANQINYGINGNTWNNATQGWPTLQWMVTNGKRLVVFSQKGWRGSTSGFAYLWEFAVENQYGTPSLLSGCESRSESDPLNQNQGKLFVVNYALNIPTLPSSILMPSSYSITNNYYWLLAKLRTCQDVSANNALPNLVKVNFFEYGLHGGPLRVIEEINREWAALSMNP